MLCLDASELSSEAVKEIATQVYERVTNVFSEGVLAVQHRQKQEGLFFTLGEGSWLAKKILLEKLKVAPTKIRDVHTDPAFATMKLAALQHPQ